MLKKYTILLSCEDQLKAVSCLFRETLIFDERTTTTGVVLCEHIRAFDLNSRPYVFVEKIPDDILRNVVDIISAEIELPVHEETAETASE